MTREDPRSPAAAAATSAATVLDLIEQGRQQLDAAGVSFGHGTTNAFDEAAWLTLWKLGLPLDDLDAVAAAPVTPERTAAVQAVIAERIATRKPAAYLTHEAWLQGVPFYVDERVIVPRSFIAELLADPDRGAALDAWLSDETTRVLDLCTGNGSLAVLAAMAYPLVQVTGSDLSTDALDVARVNVQRHGLGERVTLVESDGLAALAGPFDLILCNPPYVNSGSMDALPAEFRAEPQGALAGGADGMDLIRPILTGAIDHLAPEGLLLLEIGHEAPFFEQAFPALEFAYLPVAAGDTLLVLVRRDQLVAAFPGPKR